MKITLTNGVELNALMVTGGGRYVQGASRDTLTFVFTAEQSMDELDRLFTAQNCETIILGDGEENGGIHHGYTIRAELKREPVVVTPATESAESVVENRTFVSMAQRTYMESQIASLTETVDVLVLENLMG